jgi:hypothetical protein
LRAVDLTGAPADDLLDASRPSRGLRGKKPAAGNHDICTATAGVTELWFDGNPGAPSCISFAVRVFPETESVLVYLSLENPCPIRCEGVLTHFTIVTDSGRIFVQRLSAISTFEITIVAWY